MAKTTPQDRRKKPAAGARAHIVWLSTKGQLTIPHQWRSLHHLAPGSPLSISEDEQGRLILTPLPAEWLNPTPELQVLVQGLQQEMARQKVTPEQLLADLKAIRRKP